MIDKFIFLFIFSIVTILHIILFNIKVLKKPEKKITKDKVFISLVKESPQKIIPVEKHGDASHDKKIEKKKRRSSAASVQAKVPKKVEKKKKKVEKKKKKRRSNAASVQAKGRDTASSPKKVKPVEMHGHASPDNKEEENKKIAMANHLEREKEKERLNEEIKKLERKYLKYIQELVRKNINYPRRARKLKKEGTVLVSIDIDRFGNIKNIKIIKKSSSSILDKAALNVFNSISKFAPIPKKLKKDSWNIKIPMVYRLR